MVPETCLRPLSFHSVIRPLEVTGYKLPALSTSVSLYHPCLNKLQCVKHRTVYTRPLVGCSTILDQEFVQGWKIFCHPGETTLFSLHLDLNKFFKSAVLRVKNCVHLNGSGSTTQIPRTSRWGSVPLLFTLKKHSEEELFRGEFGGRMGTTE